ncbi:hypothetical protein P5663_10175 [Priestia flexa]|uniref:hypothetical protein n=1 Tax=Priestia flexa TaxID=86664 RepID=UPI00240E480B|nr:hypothetical protein [Priestia flexa]WEZ10170.1 hypothetical protein P5663_10175 [Priestia flexa]
MKETFLNLLLIVLLLSFTACSNENVEMDEKVQAKNTTEEVDSESLAVTHKETFLTTWKDTSFDIENNLQKPFYIKGEAKLSNYYNYKFTNEKDLFSVEVIPQDGDVSNKWYIYLNREEFKEL